jgi:hypothetical protein
VPSSLGFFGRRRREARELFRKSGIGGPAAATYHVLRKEGWLRSYREKSPVDRTGAPIPWYTYSAIEFLAERLPSTARVFEFGAGNSTLWYAARCRHVVAVDPNRPWIDRLALLAPSNVELIHAANREDWLAALSGRGGGRGST